MFHEHFLNTCMPHCVVLCVIAHLNSEVVQKNAIVSIMTKHANFSGTLTRESFMDASFTRRFRFSFIFTGLNSSESCSFNVSGLSGAINFSSPFTTESTCSWLIEAPSHHNIFLNFTTLNTRNYPWKKFSWVEIYDGGNINQTLLGNYTGKKCPFTVHSSGRFLLVVAIGDSSFTAFYTSGTKKGNLPTVSYYYRLFTENLISMAFKLKFLGFSCLLIQDRPQTGFVNCYDSASHRYVSAGRQ